MKTSMPRDVARQFHPLVDLPSLADEQAELSAKTGEISSKCSKSVQKLEREIARLQADAAKQTAELRAKHEAELAERDRKAARHCHVAIREALAKAVAADYSRSALQGFMQTYAAYAGEAVRVTGHDLTETLLLGQAMAAIVAKRDPSLTAGMATLEFWRRSFPGHECPLGGVVGAAHRALLGRNTVVAREALEQLECAVERHAEAHKRQHYAEEEQQATWDALGSSLSWATIEAAVSAIREPDRQRQLAETARYDEARAVARNGGSAQQVAEARGLLGRAFDALRKLSGADEHVPRHISADMIGPLDPEAEASEEAEAAEARGEIVPLDRPDPEVRPGPSTTQIDRNGTQWHTTAVGGV